MGVNAGCGMPLVTSGRPMYVVIVPGFHGRLYGGEGKDEGSKI